MGSRQRPVPLVPQQARARRATLVEIIVGRVILVIPEFGEHRVGLGGRVFFLRRKVFVVADRKGDYTTRYIRSGAETPMRPRVRARAA